MAWCRSTTTSEQGNESPAQARHDCRLLSRLEELDWIPVGIFYLDLSADRTGLHLIAKLHTRVLQRVAPRWQIRDAQNDSIPSARLLGIAAGHRTRSRCSWPAEQQHEIS